MTLPEQVLPKRRRQIFYDETGYGQYFGVSRREDASLQDENSLNDTSPHEDSWVTKCTARLAKLVRYIDVRK